MAEISYPYHDQEITDADYSDLARDYMPTGVVKRTATGTDLQVTANSTGMRVTVLAGRGNVRGHRYKNTVAKELTILPREGQARIDTVVMRSEYGSVNNCRLFVKKGEAGPNPKAPTLEQTTEGVWEEPLADVLVAATAVTISQANVTDRRRFFIPPDMGADVAPVAYQGIYRDVAGAQRSLRVSRNSGRCYLDGAATSSAGSFSTAGTYVVGTIQAEYRPLEDVFAIIRSRTGAGTAIVIVQATSGAILFSPSFTEAIPAETLRLSFTGINWPDRRTA